MVLLFPLPHLISKLPSSLILRILESSKIGLFLSAIQTGFTFIWSSSKLLSQNFCCCQYWKILVWNSLIQKADILHLRADPLHRRMNLQLINKRKWRLWDKKKCQLGQWGFSFLFPSLLFLLVLLLTWSDLELPINLCICLFYHLQFNIIQKPGREIKSCLGWVCLWGKYFL